MTHILVTGASGFVGSHWFEASQLRNQSRSVSLQSQKVNDLELSGVDTIIHMAGIAHRMGQPSGSIYYEVNRDITLELARKSRDAGVRHFIYLSSTKVMGDEGGYFDESSTPQPVDDYGKSKLEAELGLAALQNDRMTVSIVRPPLIYGPRVKGNVLRILELLSKPWPLPLDGIHNERSMVAVGNLIALIERIIELRAPGTFVAGDSSPISTTELVRGLAQGMVSPPSLLRLPSWVQSAGLRCAPRIAQRLFGSYVVSNEATKRALAFSPPLATRDALIATGRWFETERKNTAK